MWWVMDHFKILPTNPDFQKLTATQIYMLILMYNNDMKKKQHQVSGQVTESFTDPEFDKWLAEQQQNSSVWQEL